MNDPQEQARLLVQQAMLALSQHREDDARTLARQAAQLAPELEGVWLVMAAVSSPNAAEIYLQKALEINPNSERAKKGLEWVRGQLHKNPFPVGDNAPAEPNPFSAPIPLPETRMEPMPAIPVRTEKMSDTQPVKTRVDAQPVPAPFGKQPAASEAAVPPYPPQAIYPPITEPVKGRKQKPMALDYQKIEPKRLYSRKVMVWPWILFVVALFLGAFVWMMMPPWQIASASSQHANRQPGEIIKPSHTPTATATFTPSPTPTETPTPTQPPTETPTPEPTSTEEAREPDTNEEYVYESGDLPSVGKHERWIDVDLSSQTLAAYEGKDEVNSFLVSTGVSSHPTVTGQFHIYVKYRYTDMSGPGYYLPDVPYTMYFHDGYGLHGTYWHHNFGTPMSHGCVNLATEDAAWLYDWADIGTLVNVHY